ncbi:N-formylglutamate amidohydrolase [Marinomonas sp. 15G1-11]|uniref:N-formylglutamate amidohydrolase n=1 Tax=Marinomonas phaeophyticola TaxID=3004091 RepID=A0ABT4JZF0_9GAMM|nr:N-formylglutamate amidohydrolase [Marinomonas sp. 15G1-11]MCZ2723601.1 N-formylglutamate amidohydrolase [Marinomonas sp. 15G1-11]
MHGLEQSPAELVNSAGQSDILLVCEHASHFIPENFNNLGLTKAECLSHIGWDIGAADMAKALSKQLDASLILQRYSRLLYDCNRPPSELSAIPPLSEVTAIPGNSELTAEQRDYRVQQIYQPFHREIEAQINAREESGRKTILVTIHSFTPTYKGQLRTVELGVICDLDNVFAKRFYDQAQALSHYDIRMNEPYGPSDPVLHMVTRHGRNNQIDNVMLEVRNDLIEQADGQLEWAQLIGKVLNQVNA